jgi:cysteine-S-conjugate beta-lyase
MPTRTAKFISIPAPVVKVTVAAGPSTLLQIRKSYHRTTGEPGQGVDASLPCPAISHRIHLAAALQALRRAGRDEKQKGPKNMSSPGEDQRGTSLKIETALVTAGRDTKAQKGFVNPPVVHGSTVLYPTAEDLHAHRGEFRYGRYGTPTTKALQEALMALEGPQCAGVGIAPSGLSAITTALLAVLKSGDHLLVCDNVYRPTRNFCDGFLSRYGVETTYFDPLVGSNIGQLFKPNTKAVLVEAPGSQSFEIPDIPAIASVARSHGALVIDDNTWATPLFHRSLEQGVDISIQAATKYIGGHSDIMFGTISANAKAWPIVSEAIRLLGVCAGPDDVFLAIRGLRTLAVRLAQHYRSGLEMARWLAGRSEVARVLHPALESDPGHSIWKRDFTGASGLFSVVLKPAPQTAVDAMLNSLKLFGMGYSWGGFESLIIPFDCSSYRTATKWSPGGPTVRFHIGLENVEDLKADLVSGFKVFNETRG